jgi:hypothetical protein
MTAFGLFFVLVLIALGAIINDHYSRLTKMNWMPQPEMWRRAGSPLDPIGDALGELGRADMPYNAIAAVLGGIGKVSEMVFAPIGAVLSGVGKGLELVFKPIGAALSLVGGAKN